MGARRIVFVTFPGVQILDVTGPLEVFSSATRFIANVTYHTEVVGPTGGAVEASCGIAMTTRPIATIDDSLDTLVVCGGADMDTPAADRQLVGHIQRLAGQSRRIASVCSGAFLLAAAGLLDGRRAVTHWAECDQLAANHPDVKVDPDAIYLHDEGVWTSAGVTAGIDLALALLAEDHGRAAAATIARQLVVHLRRSGGQSQFSRLLAAQTAASEPVHSLLIWLPDNLDADLSVAALARRVNLSERQFSRVFTQQIGITPAAYIERVRVDVACHLLETTQHPVADIASTCGFGSPETMIRTFRRRLDTTPSDHRHHFGSHVSTTTPPRS
jgi:transcriptional regulator GlxA family with amidase domain